MLADVTFKIFAPTKEWNQLFRDTDYDLEKTEKELGSPFVSSQHDDFKVKPGVYYAGLNVEHYFEETGLDVHYTYDNSYHEAHKLFEYRKDRGMKFISPFEIAMMYKLAKFGDMEHEEFGVCDNEQQILDYWPHLEKSSQRHFITMTPIYKEDQPKRDGWRWEKWGTYIGTQNSQSDYLYDEEEIDMVYVFHVYTLKPESHLGSFDIEELQKAQ
jgi:hypothetical protein